MNESLFIEFVKAIMPKLSLYVSERENGTKVPRTYLHKTMLRPVYSVDQKWEGTSANTSYVAADMVAMDSELPIKKRSSIATSNGKLPKVGMKKIMKESDLNAVMLMRTQLQSLTGDAAKQAKLRILDKIIDDEYACSVGIDEKNEANFLSGLSNGIVLIEGDPDSDSTTGLGLRVNYGYFKSNCFGVEKKGTVSREDIQRVIDKADLDGNTITTIMLSSSTYNKIRKTRWAAELVADDNGQTYTEQTTLAVPSTAKFDSAFETEFGIKFVRVNRSVVFEVNGKRKNIKPWNDDKIIFLTSEEVGSLVWGTLVEATRPVANVEYTTVDQYKLISRYSKTDPLQEFTAGQALILPVIENVDSIYSIDITDAIEVDEQAEETDVTDETTTIKGTAYTKSGIIGVLKSLGVKIRVDASDETIINSINSLSDEDEEKFFELAAQYEA